MVSHVTSSSHHNAHAAPSAGRHDGCCPPLAVADHADEPVVAAEIAGIVTLRAPLVRQRVHRPGDVPHQHRAHEHAPDQQADADAQRFRRGAAGKRLANEAGAKKHHPGGQHDVHPAPLSFQCAVKTIGQDVLGVTIVDAQLHQAGIVHHQPAHMPPHEVAKRTVRVGRFIGMLVMQPVHRDPARRRVLHAADAKHHEAALQPFRAHQPAMGQQPVIGQVDAERAEHIEAQHRQRHAGPGEAPRQQRKQRGQMIYDDAAGIRPGDRPPPARVGPRNRTACGPIRPAGADASRPSLVAQCAVGARGHRTSP